MIMKSEKAYVRIWNCVLDCFESVILALGDERKS
jgi:hypothetical protein